MVADTTTPLLQFLLQGTGNNNNAWGQNLNDQVISLVEQAIAGITTINITDASDLTLSANQSRSATIVFTGTPGASKNIYMPATAKKWTIVNQTSGNGFLIFRVTGQTAAVNAPQGKSTDMISDGTTILRKDADKVGEIFYFGGLTAPAGAVECDNVAYKRADLVDLYRAIGTTWGSTDSSDFKVPPGNDTGRYIRGRTGTVPVGTIQSNQNKEHTHTGSGTTGNQSVDHTHDGSGNTGNQSASHTHSVSGQTGDISAGHWHTASGVTGTDLQNHAHGYLQPTGSTSTPGGSFGAGGPPGSALTSNQSTQHQHAYSFTSNGQSNGHTHAWSGVSSSQSASHTHSYSFTTSTQSVSHTHTYSFTTSNGSQDGTEARPESIVGIMCIRI